MYVVHFKSAITGEFYTRFQHDLFGEIWSEIVSGPNECAWMVPGTVSLDDEAVGVSIRELWDAHKAA